MLRSLIVLGIFLLMSAVAQAELIDTTATWDGASGTSTLGDGSTTTYGQTFRTPAGTPILDSFSFFMDDREELSELIEFAAYVMEWSAGVASIDLSMATGTVLYDSGSRTTTNNGAADGMEQVTFSTGGLSLDPSKQYVAFLDVTKFLDGINDGAIMGTLPLGFDAYSDGYFTIVNSPGNDFALLTMTGWNTFDGIGSPHRDAAFMASFSVPIPPSIAMLLPALILLRRHGTA